MIRHSCCPQYRATLNRLISPHRLQVFSGLLLASWWLVPQAFSQSENSYTYLGTTSETQFTVGNINPETVSVLVSHYGASGALSQATIVLGPGRQARFTGETASPIGSTRTTVIAARLPLAVSATLSDTRRFEHLAPSHMGTDLVIPFAGFAGSNAAVSVFNPGEVSASVRIINVGEDGVQVGFRSLTVQPKQTIQETVSSDLDTASAYVLVRSGSVLLPGQPILAAATIGSFNPPSDGAVARIDVAHVAGRPLLEAANTNLIPLFITGDGFFSILQVINNDNEPQQVVVTALASDGSTIPSANNPATVEVAGRGSVSDSLSTLLEFGDDNRRIGLVLVEGTSRQSTHILSGSVSQPSLATIESDILLRDSFVFHTRRSGPEFSLLLNLANPWNETAMLDLDFVLDDGTTVSSSILDIPPVTQILPSLDLLLPEAQGNGFLLVRSNMPILASGIEISLTNTLLSPLRPLRASLDYKPPSPTSLLVSGRVIGGTTGLEGVSISLNGPVTLATLTDRVGTFVFRDVPPGTYAVSAQVIGYSLDPVSRIAMVTDTHVRELDFSATLVPPMIETLSPNEIPIGSAGAQISIEGGPFLRNSRVYFESTALSTTFVDSSELRATIPTGLLSNAADVRVFVRNGDPSLQTIDSPSVQLRVGNPPPQIEALSDQPDPLIAGSPGFNLTVTGVDFLPGVVVFAGVVAQATTFVSDTELRVTISSEALTRGGFVSITAVNPGPSVHSAEMLLPVVALPPTISGISPQSAEVRLQPDLPPLTIEVRGAGFEEGAVVLVDGAIVITTFESENLLRANVPAAILSRSGIHVIQVRNPEPTLDDSFAVPFTLVTPRPVLTSVNGTATFARRFGEVQEVPLLFNGSDFSPDSLVWASAPCDTNLTDDIDDANTFKSLSTTRLTDKVLLAGLRVACAGTYTVQVRSPQPGGGVSNSLNVLVNVD